MKIMENLLYLIVHSHFTLHIPVWFVVILFALPCCLLYWYQANKLRINGKPWITDVTYHSLTVNWGKPSCPIPAPSHYQVYFRKRSEPETWRSITTTDDSCTVIISNLSINTEFVVSVRACTETEIGPLSDDSNVISTKSLAFKLRDESPSKRETMPSFLPIHDVFFQEESDADLKIRTIMIGNPSEEELNQIPKSVLIVSTPHSGKTTLLQGIMNYISGVSCEDNFRLGFAPEIMKSDQNLDWTTVYHFVEYNGGRLGVPLKLIDIPRFREPLNDQLKNISTQLTSMLESEKQGVDCICFVAQANICSLPNDQIEYIKSICGLFQGNLNTEICCILTFADSGPAHIQDFLENNIESYKPYLVNWSGLFQEPDVFSSSFWNLNIKCLKDFFGYLETSIPIKLKSYIETDSLAPEKREELLSNIDKLQPEVSEYLEKLVEINIHVNTFTTHREDILANGDFSFTIEEIKQIKTPLSPGLHVTNCMQCIYTCHDNCIYKDDHEKINCTAMENGWCKECTGHCIWSVHRNTPFIYRYESVQVTKSYQEMKTTYEKEKGEKLEFDEYLEHLNRDIEALLGRLHERVQQINDSQNELKGIKSCPLVKSLDNTIDEMINAENRKKGKGFERRIEMFYKLKSYSNMITIRKERDEIIYDKNK